MTRKGVLLVGAKGRMGRALEGLLAEEPHLYCSAKISRESPLPNEGAEGDASLVIDFSHPDQLASSLSFCEARGLPLVLGTTGFSEAQWEDMRRASLRVPLFQASNFSVGVHVLNKLLREAGRMLQEGWDLELIESHHRHKIDAPSGTALMFLETLKATRKKDGTWFRMGREGQVGERSQEEIGVHAIRGGSTVGTHLAQFLGEGEMLELKHVAMDRSIFARGAILAAKWLLEQERAPGLYGMDDLLG